MKNERKLFIDEKELNHAFKIYEKVSNFWKLNELRNNIDLCIPYEYSADIYDILDELDYDIQGDIIELLAECVELYDKDAREYFGGYYDSPHRNQ